MRKTAAWLLTLTLLLTACAKSTSPPPATGPEPDSAPPVQQPAPVPEAPDLAAMDGPHGLSLAELEAGLVRYLSQGEGSVAERLNALYDRWGLNPQDDYPRLAEADLDGDGQVEVVTALNKADRVFGTGALFIIAEKDGAVVVKRSAEADLPGVRLFTVADLAGDDRPEIVWTSSHSGAHTIITRVLVSRWEDGHLVPLPGQMVISFARLALDGRDLVLSGGLIGSVGAGQAQRARTDRYRWVDGEFQLVDRRYTESTHGYHRLQDGIVAETFGHIDEAEQGYREAMAPDRLPFPEHSLNEGTATDFGEGVRAFARFRLAALLMQEGQADEAGEVLAGAVGPFAGLSEALAEAGGREPGCRAAERWVRENPAFLEALASPIGYANPTWQPEDLCGPLPQTGVGGA